MALDIIVVHDHSNPYWQDERAFRYGEIDPLQWENLFFRHFAIRRYNEFIAEQDQSQSYDQYYSEKVGSLTRKYPLISRLIDYYEDALYRHDELQSLIEEIRALRTEVILEDARKLLDQLLSASEVALTEKAGLQLVAD